MTTKQLAANDIEALKWYLARENHGRGRVCGETKRLIDRGLLRLTRTGVYTWVATITDAGRRAMTLATVPNTCPSCGAAVDITEAEAETEVTIAPGYFVVGRSSLDTARRPCIVAACTGCEWLVEVTR
jgi:hypothetical protein